MEFPEIYPFWVNGQFGLALTRNYEILYISIHSKYFFKNFAI